VCEEIYYFVGRNTNLPKEAIADTKVPELRNRSIEKLRLHFLA
jgi:hypothetical protein